MLPPVSVASRFGSASRQPHNKRVLLAGRERLSRRRISLLFEKDGFSLARQEGDHPKAGVLRSLVIPTYRAVPVFIIRNLLRTSGMSRERNFKLMEG